MSEMMNELYYILTEEIGRQCMKEEAIKVLMIRQCALMDEIMLRLGEDGEKLMDRLADLKSEMDDMQSKALFRAALCLGTKITEPWRGVYVPVQTMCP